MNNNKLRVIKNSLELSKSEYQKKLWKLSDELSYCKKNNDDERYDLCIADKKFYQKKYNEVKELLDNFYSLFSQ